MPVGRGEELGALSAEQTEDVLLFLADLSTVMALKTTEAPAYRRVVDQRARPVAGVSKGGELYLQLCADLDSIWPEAIRGPGERSESRDAPHARGRSPLAVGDGRGVVFVSHVGEVQPSGFLPVVVGNVRHESLVSIYSQAPLLRALRDTSCLGGKCGFCEHSATCGGSRSQAYARLGDIFAEDPTCSYIPSNSRQVFPGS